jgi:hypothetical protein
MTTRSDLDRSIAAWLDAEAPNRAPAQLLEQSRDRIRATRQRRAWWPASTGRDVGRYGRRLIAIAAMLVVGVVGFNLLPTRDGISGGPATSPSPSVSPTLSPSPSPQAIVWPTGRLEAGRHDAVLGGVSFSFAVPTSGWRSDRITGMLERGNPGAPGAHSDYAYVSFDMDGTALRVFADPCGHVLGPPIGAAASALADAMTTIPGTDAVGPTDTTVGDLPAKLVELTLRGDITCSPNEFALYGVSEDTWWYLHSLDSTIRDWIVEVDIDLGPPNIGRKRVVIHTDQAAPGDELAREIQQIIDSIRFE